MTTDATPLFTPTADGKAYNLTAPGVLLLLADQLYGADREHLSEAGFIRISDTIAVLMAAASAGGFTQGDILMTMLCHGEKSKRVQDMARAACAAAGDKGIAQFFATLRKKAAS